MQVKALLLCVAVAAALNVNLAAAEQPGVPRGWTASPLVGKQFEVGYDPAQQATYLRSVGEVGEAVGALSQAVDPAHYQNQKLVLKAEVKTDDPQAQAELFLRLKAGESTHSSSTWSGKRDWYPIRVQINRRASDAATSLDYGVVLKGKGRVWIRNIKLLAPGPADEDKVVRRSPPHNEVPIPASVGKPTNLELHP